MSFLVHSSEVATRYRVEEYEALAHDPAWEDRRVELLHGVILEMSPETPSHVATIYRIHDWLLRNADSDRYQFRLGAPLRATDSEPEPDIMVVERGGPENQHPYSSPLVIEVAISSIRRDTLIKPTVYAEGVTEYWVVKPEQQEVIVHRDPGEGGYADVITHTSGQLVPASISVASPLVLSTLFTT